MERSGRDPIECIIPKFAESTSGGPPNTSVVIITRPRFEPGMPRIQSSSANQSAAAGSVASDSESIVAVGNGVPSRFK
jgi:hypothetical protein